MKREILTHPIGPFQVKEELEFLVEYFREIGYDECEAYFGFAWGNEYYSNGEWTPIRIPLDRLASQVRRVETGGLGMLGSDDLFVSFPALGLEFRFCNDSDLHMAFEHPNETTEFFYQRWKALGFSPAEWEKTSDGKTGERLRIN